MLLIISARQPSPYAGHHLTSTVVGMPTSVTVPTSPPRSGLEELYAVSHGLTMPTPLSKDTYPLVVFWVKAAWDLWKVSRKEHKTPGHPKNGQGINSSWMEDENGKCVEFTRQQEILRAARQTWVTMRAYGIHLDVFLVTPRPTVDYFCAKLESMFLELRLCADHWKVGQLWMENFSSWNNRGSRQAQQSETAPHHPSALTAPQYPSASMAHQYPTEGPGEVPQLEPQSEKASWFQPCELPL